MAPLQQSPPTVSTARSMSGKTLFVTTLFAVAFLMNMGQISLQTGGGGGDEPRLLSTQHDTAIDEEEFAALKRELREITGAMKALTKNETTASAETSLALESLKKQLETLQQEKEALQTSLLDAAKVTPSSTEEDTSALKKQLEALKEEKEALQTSLDAKFQQDGGNVVSFSFGASSNTTQRYAPVPLVQSSHKLLLGQPEWREEQGYTSPACTLQANDGQVFHRMVFLHMRKAGGSSVRAYLKDVANKYNIPFKIMEGWKEVERPGDDNTTLYITHMREPVSRTVSHYKYEMRWDCYKQLYKGVTATYDNVKMSLSDFAQANLTAGRKKFWGCSQECYTRWATAMFARDAPQNPRLQEEGPKVIGSYHMMIVSEWLKDPDYAWSLESIFGVSNIGRKKGMACERVTKEANAANPLTITDEELDLIASKNQIDIGVYKNLTTCPQGPQFWGRHIRLEPAATAQVEEEKKE